MTIAAFRYNNPFDVSLPIAGYKGPGNTVGIQGQAGYGAFPDMSTGYQAGVHRLNTYISGASSYGPKTTIGELNSVYATDPNWSAGVAKHSGIAPDAKLDVNNPDQMKALQYGVLAQEIGPDNAARVIQGQGGTVAPMSMAGPQAGAGASNAPAAPTQGADDNSAPAAPAAKPGATFDGGAGALAAARAAAASVPTAQTMQLPQTPRVNLGLMRGPFSLGG